MAEHRGPVSTGTMLVATWMVTALMGVSFLLGWLLAR